MADGRKIFVGGLDYNLTGDDLRLYFSKYGGIEDSVVLVNDRNGCLSGLGDRVNDRLLVTDRPFPGRSRGFGFVTFNDEDAIDKVMKTIPHTLGEKTVEIKVAIPKDKMDPSEKRRNGVDDDDIDPMEKTNKLFVGGIRNDMTADELLEEFRDEGAVSVDILKDRSNGKGRGFAFVIFDNEEAVDSLAKERLRKIGDKKVEMKKAQSVGKMREIERSQGRSNRYDDYNRGGGPMRSSRGGGRGGFRDNRGPGGPGGYRDNRGMGGPGGYNGGMRGSGMSYNNPPQGWGNYPMGNMGNQNYGQGYNQGPMGGNDYSGPPGGGYGNYGNYGNNYNNSPPDGNYNSTAYPGSYGNQSYNQNQGQGQNQSGDPRAALQQLQQAVQNFVASTNQLPPSDLLSGYGQSVPPNQGDGYSGDQSASGTSAVSQRTKQAAPYYR